MNKLSTYITLEAVRLDLNLSSLKRLFEEAGLALESAYGIPHDEAFTALNERERTIIALRYGMNKLHKPMPQREVAKRLNISRSYVSRIEKCAVDKIRAYMKA